MDNKGMLTDSNFILIDKAGNKNIIDIVNETTLLHNWLFIYNSAYIESRILQNIYFSIKQIY